MSSSNNQKARCGQVDVKRSTMMKKLKRMRESDGWVSIPPHHFKRQKPSEPRCGPRPIIILYLSWDGGTPVLVRCLFDTGSTSFVVAMKFVKKWKILFAMREESVPMVNFDDEVSQGGEQYTYPITMIHKEHYDMETFEVCKMDPSADLILPRWYLTVHKPSEGFFNIPPDITFRSDHCLLNCTKCKSEKFSIEYDKTLLLEEGSSETIGMIGRIQVSAL